MKTTLNIALVGNPNVGKTSLFNALTGLNYKIGNYPGITVDKISGHFNLPNGTQVNLIDLPGTYSLLPSSADEQIVLDLLWDRNNTDYPEVIVVVAELENLKRNLLILSQVKELGIPTVLVINRMDRVKYLGIEIDLPKLGELLNTPVVALSVKESWGIEDLKDVLVKYREYSTQPCLDIFSYKKEFFNELEEAFPNHLLYKLWLVYALDIKIETISKSSITQKGISLSEEEIRGCLLKQTVLRYGFIHRVLKESYIVDNRQDSLKMSSLDCILTHKFWGYIIFFSIMLLIFQAIFHWSAIPMDWIEEQFARLSDFVGEHLPTGRLNDLIKDGIIPGIGGIMPFIPQIAILFMFISILEESGYMSRVVFLMDRLMRPFGLSGKSVVPLISGNACAIPAIMSARNIEDPKQRLLTILVTPFTTCSARIPVYIILISLVVPNTKLFGFIGLQGLILTLLYALGIGSALIAALVMKNFISGNKKVYFISEMPSYQWPMLKNVVMTMVQKTSSFISGAGKIIFALSIVIWFLSSHGSGTDFEQAHLIIEQKYAGQNISEHQYDNYVAAYKLEHSYMGVLGKGIAPLVKPLGYDWKISIGLLTSFVAREVFVSTLATIYQVGSDAEQTLTIQQQMKSEVWPDTGKPVYTLASGLSLMIFYAFAMQCASTVAITKKETKSWKWAIFQLLSMTMVAYLASFIVYQLLK